MKRFSSLILAVLLFIGTFVSFSATALAEDVSPLTLPPGNSKYIQLSFPEKNNYVLDVQGSSQTAGTRVIAYPFTSSINANQTWTADGTDTGFQPIYSLLGGDLRGQYLILSLNKDNYLVTNIIPTSSQAPQKEKWKFYQGQLLNQALPDYVLVREPVAGQTYFNLKYVLRPTIVQAKLTSEAPPTDIPNPLLLIGDDQDNTLVGKAGDDTLVGLKGNDTLTGGLGKDKFHFNGPEEAIDTITDFSSSQEDKIQFFGDGFDNLVWNEKLGSETLSSDVFSIGTYANSWTNYIIYNPSNGIVYFEPKPNPQIRQPSQTQKALVKLAPGLNLTNKDFIVVWKGIWKGM